ncbi:CGNR zinc finger domain-containing protein [Paenibacillus sp. TRM 82003]|nr:CGNR zinc finger domain-containing protein [Paenibacillus sp. TRM 82003]MCI3923459.1 CGNR zinc finger domain-containing protein [Paenibacillus sp. TRM 82003]
MYADARDRPAAAGCSWDHTKNHSRRWCSMRNCGNRAKMRRYQARKKEDPTTNG